MSKLQTRGVVVQIPELTRSGFCRLTCPLFCTCEFVVKDEFLSPVRRPGPKCPWGQAASRSSQESATDHRIYQ